MTKKTKVEKPKLPAKHKPSDALIDALKTREKLMLTVYQDEGGQWTIGYGHLVKPGEKYFPYGDVKEITKEEADELFYSDLKEEAIDSIVKYVQVELTQGNFDGLCSFVFNIGMGQFASSTLLKRLNNGRYQEAGNELSKWVFVKGNKSKGLMERRAEERNFYFS